MLTHTRTRHRVALATLALIGLTTPAIAAPRLLDPPMTDRRNDTQPHFGGSALAKFTNTEKYECTSGFAVRTQDGRQGMVTAGHCFARDVRVGSGKTITGGPNDYGTVSALRLDGTRDMEVLTGVSAPQTYAPTIWVAPRVPRAIRVVGKADPAPGDKVCFSGMVSKAVCGYQVLNLDRGTACPDPAHSTDCTSGLAQATNPDFAGSVGGDSGSPVYKLDAKGNATIVGMLIGGAPAEHGLPALMVFHTVKQLEGANGLAVTVLTQKP